MANHDQEKAFKFRYFEAHILCPLLDDNHLCTIYKIRPTNCVTYAAHGSPDFCKEDILTDNAIAFTEVERGMIMLMRNVLRSPDLLPLPVAVVNYLDDR